MSLNTLPTPRLVPGAADEIAVYEYGDKSAPPVVMAHSILSSSAMWIEQAALLASKGYRVVLYDTRGHGASKAPPPPYTMDRLAADTVAVLDALDIAKAHYVGLSLGGMSGTGLGIRHGARLLSLVLCDFRADAPPAFAAPWDERIAIADKEGTTGLAVSTTERWFGKAFIDAHPDTGELFRNLVSQTARDGFTGCARAIQGLAYLLDVGQINVPTTLIVGANDGPLPAAMADLQTKIAGSVLEVIPDAGHLPNIDQPAAFNAALLRHFDRVKA